tara:strand:- start:111 stop:500 length:390 start_codon:yes stop_codon:yes gene_type:complete
MSIWLNFINVVIPINVIEKKLDLDFDDFFEKYNKGIKYHDDHLFSTGAMSPDHTESIVKYFESQGLTVLKTIENKEYFEDLCIVELLFGGPTRPCEWLEFDAQEKIVWLKGTDKGEMAVPDFYKDLSLD